MMNKVWARSADGTIEYVSLVPELLEGALKVMREAFYPYESVCRAVGVQQNPEAIPELEQLTIRAAKDGVSFVAVESKTGRVVGAAFNKLQVNANSEEGSYFENYAKACLCPSSRAVVQFMRDADAVCDLFVHCNVDCLLEIMFLATLPEFRNNSIGRQLCEVSTEAARLLSKGENVKQSMDGTKLTLEPVPKLVAALFTSPVSQRIGRALSWEIAARVSYEKFFHEGRTFASFLGDSVPDTTLEYKKL